jgi:UDP-2,3-diacylglucosamine pyrophosphatase LpxH
MDVRRLIISDLHLGSSEALLGAAAALDRIEPELAWADELVINGDLLELVFASLEDAVSAARPFLALVNRHVERVHYVLGNHDHHLVALAGDERRFCDVLGTPAPAAFRVAPAERLLRALCPDADVVSSYPLCELDGMVLMHGHYVAPHLASSDWRLWDRAAWFLTGAEARPEQLAVAEYEGLIAPLYEFMYEIANLPSGRRTQQRFERWLGGAAAIARVPQRAARQHGTSMAQVLEAMQAVCRNLDVPAGSVVFGHTHVPLDGVATPDGRHRLYNSGAWVWDRRLRDGATYREHSWPGTVLRATGDALELRGLLADCDDGDLQQMLGAGAVQRGRSRLRPKLAAAGR